MVVGLSIAALVVADFIYAESHDRVMWMPSRFPFRVVGTTVLLAYFVARETRKMRATLVQVFAMVLVAGAVHVAIAFRFH